MVAIDTSERAHIIDVRSEEELEVVDLVDVQLAYSTSFYKSLATGGNVSKALVRLIYPQCLITNHRLRKVKSMMWKSVLLGTLVHQC